MTFDRHDVVVVPFPFTDRNEEKRRPALVLSDLEGFNRMAAHYVLAMITSARHSGWPLDVPIRDLEAAGLSSPCVVRMKLFTLPEELILRRAGNLTTEDTESVEKALSLLWGRRSPSP